MITVKPPTIRQITLQYLRVALIFAVLLPAIVLVAAPSASAQQPDAGAGKISGPFSWHKT